MTKRYEFGKWVEDKALAESTLDDLFDQAALKQKSVANYPVDKTLKILERVGEIWSDPTSTYHKQALEVLPKATGFSPEMISMGLKEMKEILSPDALTQKMNTEFRQIPRGPESWYRPETGTILRWHPIGTVFHVLSGNVFLVGPGSLVEGLLTGNVNILKMSSGETYFMPQFLQSMAEVDTDGVVSSSVALVSFSSGRKDLIQCVKSRSDGVVVWGGEEAVQSYRSNLPSKTRLVIFGPKMSFGLVTNQGFASWGVEKVATQLSNELGIWDQNACTAPQVCFVQGEENAQKLVDSLPEALNTSLKEFPPGIISSDEAVEIEKLRSIFEVREGLGEGTIHAAPGFDWTVLLDKEVDLKPSPLHRTIRVIPFESLDEIYSVVEPMKSYVQTVGLVATSEESLFVSNELSARGALRITTLGSMSGGDIDEPHDGAFDLPQLMNLVSTKWKSKNLRPFDCAPREDRQAVIDRRFRLMVNEAIKSPFYEKRIGGLVGKGAESLKQVPPLTREEFEKEMQTQSLKTRPDIGGYVTRSGGSTGDPKFSYFDGQDWQAMIDNGVRIFQASGLEKTDRLANLLMMGDLYGSFVSFNDVNKALGLKTFAFGEKFSISNFLDVWQRYNINAIQGITSFAMATIRKCKEQNPAFSFEKFMYAGLPLSPGDREFLTEQCGVTRISSIIGTTEANQIGYQCTYLSGKKHHLVDDYNIIEFLDEDGNEVSDGEVGRMAVTTLMKHNFPLFRYLIGDAGKVTSEDCPCGRKDRVFEHLGRWDDILSIGRSNFRFSDLEKNLSSLSISGFQLICSFHEGMERLDVKFVPSSSKSVSTDSVKEKIFQVSKGLATSYEKQELLLDVEAVQQLITHPRTGKTRAIIDKR